MRARRLRPAQESNGLETRTQGVARPWQEHGEITERRTLRLPDRTDCVFASRHCPSGGAGKPPARLRGTVKNSPTGQTRPGNRPPSCGAVSASFVVYEGWRARRCASHPGTGPEGLPWHERVLGGQTASASPAAPPSGYDTDSVASPLAVSCQASRRLPSTYRPPTTSWQRRGTSSYQRWF